MGIPFFDNLAVLHAKCFRSVTEQGRTAVNYCNGVKRLHFTKSEREVPHIMATKMSSGLPWNWVGNKLRLAKKFSELHALSKVLKVKAGVH